MEKIKLLIYPTLTLSALTTGLINSWTNSAYNVKRGPAFTAWSNKCRLMWLGLWTIENNTPGKKTSFSFWKKKLLRGHPGVWEHYRATWTILPIKVYYIIQSQHVKGTMGCIRYDRNQPLRPLDVPLIWIIFLSYLRSSYHVFIIKLKRKFTFATIDLLYVATNIAPSNVSKLCQMILSFKDILDKIIFGYLCQSQITTPSTFRV